MTDDRARVRRRRRRHLQPRRPARPDARRAGRPDPAPGRGVRRRQRQHRPHPRGARRRAPTCRSPAIRTEENLGGAGGFHLGVTDGVRRGLRPDLADGRRRGPGARLPGGAARRTTRPLPDGGPRGPGRAAWSRRPRPASTCATRSRSAPRPRASRRRTAPGPRCPSGSRSRTSRSRASWSAAGSSTRSGCPDPSYFIFYDDVDFAIRARRAGFRIWAVRDAVLVRQLDFDQQHELDAGRGTTCTATSSWCTSGTARTRWSALKPWLITARGRRCSARCGAVGPRRAM